MPVASPGRSRQDRAHALPAMAWRPVVLVAAVVGTALALTGGAYGYHRDELYFRMLPLQWGYVDQPPLAPVLAQATTLLADEPWAMHLPGALLMAASVVVTTMLARELGGERRAQVLCAAACATSLVPLEFARVLLTATVDLVVWPAILLLVARAVLRGDPRWWLAVGAVVGLSTYNKLLVSLLVVSLLAAVALVGPRSLLRSGWVWAGAAVATVLALPQLLYQATHGWPQLTMGAALAAENADQVRLVTVPLLLVLLGPALVPVWVAGGLALLRRPAWRGLRFVAVALPVLVGLTLLGGSMPYYPLGLLTGLLAAGCVVVADRPWAVPAVVANGVVSALITLPLVPVQHLGSTPIPTVNQIAQDQLGWQQYAADVGTAWASLDREQQRRTAVVAGNYGEAGALDRYGPAVGITQVLSPHNELYWQARPSASTDAALVVGLPASGLRPLFDECRSMGELDHGLGVDNQEQGRPILLCTGPRGGWDEVWPRMRDYA